MTAALLPEPFPQPLPPGRVAASLPSCGHIA